MAGYEPKNWQCGDTITADDLNHMEEGIANAGGALVVRKAEVEGNRRYYDKTLAEVIQALESGIPVYCQEDYLREYLQNILLSLGSNTTFVNFASVNVNTNDIDTTTLLADSMEGRLYIVLEDEGSDSEGGGK